MDVSYKQLVIDDMKAGGKAFPRWMGKETKIYFPTIVMLSLCSNQTVLIFLFCPAFLPWLSTIFPEKEHTVGDCLYK